MIRCHLATEFCREFCRDRIATIAADAVGADVEFEI